MVTLAERDNGPQYRCLNCMHVHDMPVLLVIFTLVFSVPIFVMLIMFQYYWVAGVILANLITSLISIFANRGGRIAYYVPVAVTSIAIAVIGGVYLVQFCGYHLNALYDFQARHMPPFFGSSSYKALFYVVSVLFFLFVFWSILLFYVVLRDSIYIVRHLHGRPEAIKRNNAAPAPTIPTEAYNIPVYQFPNTGAQQPVSTFNNPPYPTVPPSYAPPIPPNVISGQSAFQSYAPPGQPLQPVQPFQYVSGPSPSPVPSPQPSQQPYNPSFPGIYPGPSQPYNGPFPQYYEEKR